ncbi:hypothetical protein N0V88_006607 [Collariella sp. IMI 366227]|nr:hypothetical protein N0V88_006607 [Collariella sp. IMI 366227]
MDTVPFAVPGTSLSSALNFSIPPCLNSGPQTAPAAAPVRRFAQIIKLKPAFVAKYKEVHAAAWPEVLEQIRDCNIRDYSIYHDPSTSLLFASFKYVGTDFDADMARMRQNPKVREWWKMTDEMQESLVPGATSSESGEPGWWKDVEEVFYAA